MTENKLAVFENVDFGKLRTVIINGEPWFVGKDVAATLGYERPTKAVVDHVDSEDRDEVPIQDSIGRMQKTPVINESGLYSLILSSKLSTAKKFKHWVTSEVLPTIRKTKSFVLEKPDSYTIDDPIARAKRWIEEKEAYIALENKIKEDKPLVDFANKILSSDSSISMNDMAKLAAKNGIKIGRNRLFRLLRGKGILDSRNVPYQRYIEVQPWFETTEFTYYANGKNNISITTKVTPKGQIGIVKMLKDSSLALVE